MLHLGLRVPGVVSSFGDVKRASVSNWASLKKSHAAQRLKKTDRVTNKSALETFNHRYDLQRPGKVPLEAVQNLSYYAFWWRFDVDCGRLVLKQREKFVALSGNGWPAQAKRDRKLHVEYARKTLYAYVPCPGYAGTDYIDAAARTYFEGSYADMLAAFVKPTCVWCPKWIRRNYEIQNKPKGDAVDAPPRVPPLPRTDRADATETEAATKDALSLLPHADTFSNMNFIFGNVSACGSNDSASLVSASV